MHRRKLIVFLNNSSESVHIKTYIEKNLGDYCDIDYCTDRDRLVAPFIPFICTEENPGVLRFGLRLRRYLEYLTRQVEKEAAEETMKVDVEKGMVSIEFTEPIG